MNTSETPEGHVQHLYPQIAQASAPMMQNDNELRMEEMKKQMENMQQLLNQKQPIQQVIVNQAPAHKHNPDIKDRRKWQNNIFNCCSAGGCTCLQAFCCPISMMASTRSKFDGSNACFTGCCMTPCAIRNIVREGYGIKGNCLSDLCYTTVCLPCSAVQMENEVQLRGPNRQGM